METLPDNVCKAVFVVLVFEKMKQVSDFMAKAFMFPSPFSLVFQTLFDGK